MEDFNVKAVSLFGMEYQRARLEAAAINIANANTISVSKEHAFEPLQVSSNIESTTFMSVLNATPSINFIEKGNTLPIATFKPEHPLADESGFIYKPNINVAEEMIVLNSAIRSYEANVKAFNTYKEMTAKAMEIGK